MTYTFDVRGLRALSQSSENEFAAALEDIATGEARLFSCAYNEFAKVYDDEAEVFKGTKLKREPLSEEHRESIIAIAESAQATFGFRGPYDKAIEWQIAGVACCDGDIIVTDAKGKLKYLQIDGVQAVTFDEFLDRHN
ncbi:hypothetical protein [Bradyrhizobium sp. USDA 4502]